MGSRCCYLWHRHSCLCFTGPVISASLFRFQFPKDRTIASPFGVFSLSLSRWPLLAFRLVGIAAFESIREDFSATIVLIAVSSARVEMVMKSAYSCTVPEIVVEARVLELPTAPSGATAVLAPSSVYRNHWTVLPLRRGT